MNKTALSIICVALIIGLVIIFLGGKGGSYQNAEAESVQNVEIKDGVQYVTVVAKGGYLPRISNAQAGIPTKLIVKTNGTYDCSAALVIRSANFQKVLAQTGEEVIDLGESPTGTSVQGTCSMGMYNFEIMFN